ncbi:hypothetical protein B296_00048441 [Ensete ventricosum]|uniref:Uncharacterized protein n=1 Tax=Ensete ventricosum TaxID=4639 RepID=A0A426YUT4_ENSVE|nr:hypothetical protein B296_00048441 [Ensete ventricosum]
MAGLGQIWSISVRHGRRRWKKKRRSKKKEEKRKQSRWRSRRGAISETMSLVHGGEAGGGRCLCLKREKL